MTLTEFGRYKIDTYLELGYITKKQAQKYHRDLDMGGIIALVLPLLILAGILVFVFGG